MKNIYIHQFSTLGDMILCNGLIRVLSKKNNTSYLNIFWKTIGVDSQERPCSRKSGTNKLQVDKTGQSMSVKGCETNVQCLIYWKF